MVWAQIIVPSSIETSSDFSTDGSISVQNLISGFIQYIVFTTLCRIFEDPIAHI